MAASRSCPICLGTVVDRLHSMSFTLVPTSPLPRAYTVVACQACGFVYADTTGTLDDYARHYTNFSLYEDPRIATGSGTSEEDRERLEDVARLVARRFPADARILDVGCGNGGLLLALRQQGFSRLTGIDPSEGCVARVREIGFTATRATLDDIPGHLGSFDLVMLSHVLEHLLQPVSALVSLKRLLAAEGCVYMETPDASRYTGRPFVPYYFFDTEHINHFDEASLANLARAAGLEFDCAGTKDIPVKGGHRYPAVYGIAAKRADRGVTKPLPDATLRQAISSYLAECTARSRQFGLLEREISAGTPLALWGAGSFAQRFMELPWIRNHQIVAVVDRDRKKVGQEFAGCRIAPPDEGLKDLPLSTVVLVLVALDADSVAQEYRRLGLPYRCLIASDPSTTREVIATRIRRISMRNDPTDLYLDLLKKSLTYSLWDEPPVPAEFHDPKRPAWKRAVYAIARRLLGRWDLQLVQPRFVDPRERAEGVVIGPTYAHTLIGLRRLDNLQHCIEAVLRDSVPGDLIETGVWRGGACIFMRGVLAAHGITGRRVFLADSFEGLPPPDAERWPADRGDTFYLNPLFAVSRAEVEKNFRNYGLLDSHVVFLSGWFRDTLPVAPVERLAVMRLDGDMYGSTMEALASLYPKLSPGGFCIIDDYALSGCRQAVDEFRAREGVREPLVEIDWTGRYWRKSAMA